MTFIANSVDFGKALDLRVVLYPMAASLAFVFTAAQQGITRVLRD
jgi:hypothetical protein